MNGLLLLGAFLLATVLTCVTNWLALTPWRRSRNQHWTEQARLYHPVRAAARSNLLMIPAVLVLATLLSQRLSSPLWAFIGIASVLGAHAGSLPMEHEVFPRIAPRELLRMTAVSCLFRFLVWFVFLAAVALMPKEFNQATIAMAGGVIVLWVILNHGGLVWVGARLGLLVPAPDHLLKIVTTTSARMNVPFREVFLMRVPRAQAAAYLDSRKLIFTERLLQLLSEEEIAAVCGHELAHLTESRKDRASRWLLALAFLPWIFLRPLRNLFGDVVIMALLLGTVGFARLYRRISVKLECRADSVAKENEGDAGTYARALAKIYEDSLVPAVLRRQTTHPNLYDRIVAAGGAPDFPRPAPASRMAWHGWLFTGLSGGLLWIILMVHIFQHLPRPDTSAYSSLSTASLRIIGVRPRSRRSSPDSRTRLGPATDAAAWLHSADEPPLGFVRLASCRSTSQPGQPKVPGTAECYPTGEGARASLSRIFRFLSGTSTLAGCKN